MKRSISIILLFIYIGVSPSWAQKLIASEEEKIDELAKRFMKTSGVPGMAISVSKKGVLAFSKGYGQADLEQLVAVDPALTKFRIANISKTLTADAIMQLVEAGKINLDDPVQKYVPSFPKKRWPITTRQIAGHLGGIRHYRDDEFLSSEYYANVSKGLTIFQNDNLIYEPGTKFSYSSYGYNLISAVIEGAAGMDYLTYMKLNVFDKLQMKNTVPDNISKIIAHRGRYYGRADGNVKNSPYVDNSYKWAGGGFLSTSEDLIIFARAHIGAGYLTESSLKTLTTSQKTSGGLETNYGLGWSIKIDSQGYQWVGHGGGAIGGTCNMIINLPEEIIIVVLTNLSGASLGELAQQIGWIVMKE